MMEQNGQESDFSAKELQKRASKGLDPISFYGEDCVPVNLQAPADGLCPAAVLVPIVNRGKKAAVLLTKRADDHPHHAGQISFPGGKIAPEDKNIEATALRETYEETGVEARYINLLGHLDRHSTGTGFTIFPVVGLLDPLFHLRPCAREVAEIFEVPLSFLMKGDNYRIEEIVWRGRMREFYVIDYGSYRIWGATAAILKKLQERLYGLK